MSEVDQSVAEKDKKDNDDWRNCPKCGSTPKDHEMRDFDPRFRDGDIYCTKCGGYVRMWDPS